MVKEDEMFNQLTKLELFDRISTLVYIGAGDDSPYYQWAAVGLLFRHVDIDRAELDGIAQAMAEMDAGRDWPVEMKPAGIQWACGRPEKEHKLVAQMASIKADWLTNEIADGRPPHLYYFEKTREELAGVVLLLEHAGYDTKHLNRDLARLDACKAHRDQNYPLDAIVAATRPRRK
jgi:hypothetical protein